MQAASNLPTVFPQGILRLPEIRRRVFLHVSPSHITLKLLLIQPPVIKDTVLIIQPNKASLEYLGDAIKCYMSLEHHIIKFTW